MTRPAEFGSREVPHATKAPNGQVPSPGIRCGRQSVSGTGSRWALGAGTRTGGLRHRWRRTIGRPRRGSRSPTYAGKVRIRAVLTSGHALVGRDLELVLRGSGPGGAKLEARHAVRRTDAGREQVVDVDLVLPDPGPYQLRAKVHPASAGPDDKPSKAYPLAISQLLFTRVLERGTLRLRTDLDYYSGEREARVRGTLLGKRVVKGTTAHVEVRPPETGPAIIEAGTAGMVHRGRTARRRRVREELSRGSPRGHVEAAPWEGLIGSVTRNPASP